MSEGIGGTSDWYEKPNYPVTCAELKTMIDAEWPKVAESAMAIECIRLDSMSIVEFSDPELPEGVDRLWVEHGVVTSGGFKAEYEPYKNSQLFFSEEEAIRALWFQYRLLTPPKDFETGSFGVLFIWRDPPEIMLRHGTDVARMRYSGVYRTRNGEHVAMWSGK